MKILITGGTGFLGSHLARHFAGAGDEVLVLARMSSSTARLADIEGRFTLLRFESDADIRQLLDACKPQCIIHTACNYGRNGEDFHAIAAANLWFGITTLNAAIHAGVGSFINTDTTLERQLNAYTLSKKQFAEWGQWLAQQQRIQFINVLLEHMYGAGDDAARFTTHLIRSCLRDTDTLALTKGEQLRDFLYIDDVVAAYSTLTAKLSALGMHEDIPVGSGQAVSVRQFAETVRELAGSRTRLDFGALPYRDNEPMFCQADTARLQSLGWRPQYDLAGGIRKTIQLEKSS